MKEEVRLSDDVSHLETEQEQVTNKIRLIDNTLEEMKIEIETLKKPVVETVETSDKENQRKQCKYDRKGYCKESENCLFAHSNEICEIYLEQGVCWKPNCYRRHPKQVKFTFRVKTIKVFLLKVQILLFWLLRTTWKNSK